MVTPSRGAFVLWYMIAALRVGQESPTSCKTLEHEARKREDGFSKYNKQVPCSRSKAQRVSSHLVTLSQFHDQKWLYTNCGEDSMFRILVGLELDVYPREYWNNTRA
ncbi:hypothetical protein N7468_007911 [Penicillium chermesinum]|uniref:Secreted protein n=1 Tax=Penicillium chermesinum TaxID=63820 RepID=A0A9W9TI57_9EURO|nr:uncharacterized protein N7468_007911 [Penicillium chermesinum]KAJ5223369.1 hypothetical protein N7468_007911 [Penicillium chermesinum]